MAVGLARLANARRLPVLAADRALRPDVRLPILRSPWPTSAEQTVAGRYPSHHLVRLAAALCQHTAAEHHDLCAGGSRRPEHAVRRVLSLAERLPSGTPV